MISIVAPLFNESETLPKLVERLNNLMATMPNSIEIVLVNDGSRDATAELMQQIALADPRYTCIFLARNYGHQIALSAGLAAARFDVHNFARGKYTCSAGRQARFAASVRRSRRCCRR